MPDRQARSAAQRRDWRYGGSDPLLDEPKFVCARCLKAFVVYEAMLSHYRANDREAIDRMKPPGIFEERLLRDIT